MLMAMLGAFQIASAALPTVYNGRAGQTAVRPPEIDTTIAIDGSLSAPVWQRAAVLTGFSLYQPVDQRPAPDSTNVLVWYSPTAIYFGIQAFETHGPVHATLADRDKISGDDNIEIHLDTFDERSRAFVFIVNPLGVQADGIKNERGGFIPGSNVFPGQNDLTPDFIWESRGQLTPWGYQVEIRIPFSSLRYPALATERWGIQVQRNVQHSGYQETWTPAVRANASFITQEGTLVGMSGMRHGQVVELNPELTNTVSGTPCCSPDMASWQYHASPQLGGNIRWGLGSNFVLNGTVKPDFSQVEADAAQIAADSRFALFYPEKRPFFVEGSDAYNVPNTLVYTRQLVQPSAAAKLTGKLGRTDVAILSAFDAPQTTPDGSRPLVDIVRLQRAFGDQSTAGLLYSDRVGGGRSNRVGGGDVHIVFGKLYYAQFQGVLSTTHMGDSTANGTLWEAVVDRTGRAFGFHYNVLGIAPQFAADNGFVQRTGVVEPKIANRFTLYGGPGALIERFETRISTNGVWRYNDFFALRSILEDQASANTQFTLRGGWQVTVTPSLSTYAFDPSAYTSYRTGSPAAPAPFTPSPRTPTALGTFGVTSPQFATWDASISTTLGNDVDFQETSRVHRQDYNATVDLRPTGRLRVTGTYLSSQFTRRSDGERVVYTRIPRLKVEYQVARPVFVRVVAQYQSSEQAPLIDPRTGTPILLPNGSGGYAPAGASTSNGLRVDWLFSYRPTPGTVFFLGYGNSMAEPDPLAFTRLRRTSDAFFIKLSYLLRTSPF
ncbi:MAG TPA: DUF5916 domain-containing protein [Gemmatimonadaceae bacterium]|nr:DUF5916 domain-containing protein [Gemmatimonadaceae bacterium]